MLIVDDDQHALVALERVLEGVGYSTGTAWGGCQALAHSEKAEFDLPLVNEHVPIWKWARYLISCATGSLMPSAF
jgi:CheY-like chemotaxis protein